MLSLPPPPPGYRYAQENELVPIGPTEEQAPKTATGSAPCSCWETTDNRLREKGYKISDACSALSLAGNAITVRRFLPLARADGKRLKATDAKGVTISFCPFCGQPLANR